MEAALSTIQRSQLTGSLEDLVAAATDDESAASSRPPADSLDIDAVLARLQQTSKAFTGQSHGKTSTTSTSASASAGQNHGTCGGFGGVTPPPNGEGIL